VLATLQPPVARGELALAFTWYAAPQEPQRLRLVHARPGIFAPGLRLYLTAGHILAAAHLEYHYRRIFLACDS